MATTSLVFRPVQGPIGPPSRHRFSGDRHEKSLRALAVLLMFVGVGAGCSARPLTPAPVDGGTGGTLGTGGAGTAGAGSGGAGHGGGSGGVNPGTGGSAPDDGGVNCALVGCGAPPVCSVGCHETCGCCACASGQRNGDMICTGGCYAPVPTDAAVDQTADVPTSDASDGAVPILPADAAPCESIASEYATTLSTAQECTVGAANQCGIQVRAGFFCNCMTFANGSADSLTEIAARYTSTGCRSVCGGTCAQVPQLPCVTDATSSTGGRCKLAGVLNLTAADNGRAFSVSVGSEVDITLESVAMGDYANNVMLSSELATVLEITIPAGPALPNGATHLYRVRALAAGSLQIQIPFAPNVSGTTAPAYTVTITIR